MPKFLQKYLPVTTYEPILISFDISDHIYVWIVNESIENIKGKLVVQLFNPTKNMVIKSLEERVCISSGQSKMIRNLDKFGQFKRENILFAYMVDEYGHRIARNNDVADIERHLRFPDAKINLEIKENFIIVSTDKFARCIELSGNDDGDEFGWFFEDNYFDLLPSETKEVKILGKHKNGKIKAKAYYSEQVTEIKYNF